MIITNKNESWRDNMSKLDFVRALDIRVDAV